MASIELRNITCAYGKTTVLRDLNLAIDDGCIHALIGPSGCGKTTTLRTVAGFLTPSAGQIIVGGRDITHLPPEKRKMGVVFQNYALFPQMTVEQNVAYGLKVAHVKKPQISARVQDCLELLSLTDIARKNAMDLSGGQQQRVAIARALAPGPLILLLDEPMSNLDVELRQKMRAELRQIQQTVGVTTLLITHDQQDALSLADKISVLHNGQITQTATPQQIYTNPKTKYIADFLGDTNYILINTDKKGEGEGEGGSPVDAVYAPDRRYISQRRSNPTPGDEYFAQSANHTSPSPALADGGFMAQAYRPEELYLSLSANNQTLLTGTVFTKTFRGFYTSFEVAPDYSHLSINSDNTQTIKTENFDTGQTATQIANEPIKVDMLNNAQAPCIGTGNKVFVCAYGQKTTQAG